MEISTLNPSLYFKLFYILAFAFIFLMVIHKSIKRGYQLRSILLLLTTITLFSVIGSRLFTIPVDQWLSVLNSESNLDFSNRSAVGGLLFGFIGLIVAKQLFGFGRPLLDLYAWTVPIGLGIQKMGCFINGCCYGKPSEVFWGVAYPKGTNAHFNHWSANMIDVNAPFSMSVHPVQLYETLGLFMIAFIVWKSRSFWKKNLSTLLFSFFLFFTFRFIIEFIRDPVSSQFNEHYLFGIRTFQWMIFGVGLCLGLVLFLYEKYVKVSFESNSKPIPHFRVDITYILLISIVIYTFDGLLTKFELVAIWIKFIPAVLLSVYYLLTNLEYKKYRMALSFVLLLPFYVMAQTVQTDSSKVTKYQRIDFGGSFGDFLNEVRYNPQTNDCGGTSYTHEYFKNTYSIGGVGYSQITEKGNNRNTFGVNVHLGNITSTNLTTNEKKSQFTYGVNPYFKYDWNWVGLGVGLQVGSLHRNPYEALDEANISDAYEKNSALFEYYFRLGRRDWLDIDYNYGFLFPSPYPTAYGRVSIGSGFGKKSDYSLRYGKIYPLESNFISAEGLITDQLGVNFMYIFKEKNDFHDGSYRDGSGKIVFGLNYRFGFKNK